MTSLLIHMEGSADKVATAIVDCRARSIDVLPPDINQSREDFAIVDGRIRFGLAAVKNVGQKAVEFIVQERAANGDFKSLQDLCDRVGGFQDVNRRVLESLVRCGACDALGERNQILMNLDDASARADSARRDRESGQTSLFGEEVVSEANLRAAEPMPDEEKLRAEKELLGLYLSDHPLRRIAAELARLTDAQAVEITSDLQDTEVRVGGLVRDVRRVVTRKGQIMAYAQLEDLTGPIDVILFPRVYEEYRHVFQPEAVVVIAGKVDARGSSARAGNAPPALEGEEPEPAVDAERASVVADQAWPWDDPDCAPVARRQVVHLSLPSAGPELMGDLAQVLVRHPGPDELYLHIQVAGHEVVVQPGDRYHVAAGPDLAAEVDALFGRPVTRLETVRAKAQSSNGNGRSRRNGQ